MPGVSVRPPASIVSAPLSLTSPMATILPSLTATSARLGSCPRPSTTVAPRMTRSTMKASLLATTREGTVGGERRMIDEIADRCAHLHDLHGLGETVDHRTDHGDAAQALHQARGNLRRVQARHDQDVGGTSETREWIGRLQKLEVERHVDLHLAVVFEVDFLGIEDA